MNDRLQIPVAPAPRASRWWIAAAIALTLLGLALRVRGIGHGLPMQVEQDSKIPYQVELLRRGDDAWTTDREFRWYPLFVAYCVQTWPAPHSALPGAPLEEHLVAAAAPQMQVRFTVAMLAALMIPATYLLAALFLERRWALVAAGFSAFSLLATNFSQQARPHAAAGAVFAWALLAFVRMRRRGDVLGRGMAGGALALSIGCLQSGVALAPAFVVAELARKTFQRRWLDWRWIVALAPVGLGVLFFYPFHFAGADVSAQPGSDASALDQGGHLLFLESFNGGGVRTIARALWSYEPVLAVLAPIGVALWCATWFARRRAGTEARPESFTRRRDLWVVLAFALPYATVLAAYDRTYERFLIPLVPMLACSAAYALSRGASALKREGAASVVLVGALALAPGAWLCWKLGTVRGAPHTTELAARWLEDHRAEWKSADIALTPQLDLPLAREPEGFANWMPGGIEAQFTWPWSRYQAALPGGCVDGERWRLRWWRPRPMLMGSDPAAYVAQQGGGLLVAEVFAENRVSPAATVVRQWLLANARLLARFSPDSDPDASDHPLGYQEETSVAPGIFFRRLARARGTGPVIEIFELGER